MCILCVLIDSYNKFGQKISLDSYIQEQLKDNIRLDCSNCPLLKELPIFPNITYLWCYNCPLLKELPIFPNITYLWCNNCPLLKEIPVLPNIQVLVCNNCPLLKEIPFSPNITYLDCNNCPLLKEIPVLPNIQTLWCSDCPLIKEIPVLSSIQTLLCCNCPLLRIINDEVVTILRCGNCPKLFYSPIHRENKLKINRLRNFIRNNYKYFVFRHLIKSRTFCEHYYSPDNKVGKMVKLEIGSFISSI
jgi:hypothetical protein